MNIYNIFIFEAITDCGVQQCEKTRAANGRVTLIKSRNNYNTKEEKKLKKTQ